MILSDNKDLEKVSNTIFDISEQMGYNIELFNYKNEHQAYREEVIEHFYNLSSIFSKSNKQTSGIVFWTVHRRTTGDLQDASLHKRWISGL